MTIADRPVSHIIRGIPENLSTVPHHKNFPGITRYLLLGRKLFDAAPMQIAVHSVSIANKHSGNGWRYAGPHKHDYDELNIIWSDVGTLIYRVELDGVEHVVESPSSVIIPAGVVHRAEAIDGVGSFFCIQLT